MGLDDRDYMRQRNRRTVERLLKDMDRPFTPPAPGPSLSVMVAGWVAAAFLVYKAYGWWNEHHPRRDAPAVSQQQVEPLAHAPAQEPSNVVAPPAHAYAPLPPSRPVTEPAPQATAAPRPQTGGTLYLCRDYSGGTFWASNHCNQHNALIERMVSVPAGMSFEQQVHLAEQRRQALAMTTNVQVTSANVPQAPPSNKALCESLDARVTQLDAMARQPQSGPTQDWIRQERQKTRDEQFRLRC